MLYDDKISYNILNKDYYNNTVTNLKGYEYSIKSKYLPVLIKDLMEKDISVIIVTDDLKLSKMVYFMHRTYRAKRVIRYQDNITTLTKNVTYIMPTDSDFKAARYNNAIVIIDDADIDDKLLRRYKLSFDNVFLLTSKSLRVDEDLLINDDLLKSFEIDFNEIDKEVEELINKNGNRTQHETRFETLITDPEPIYILTGDYNIDKEHLDTYL